jgi:hypothetical protein
MNKQLLADEEAKRALGSISRNAPSASINPVPSTSSGLLPATLTSTADTHPDQVLAGELIILHTEPFQLLGTGLAET